MIADGVPELYTMLLLVLGCAVQCNHRERYITQIKQMDSAAQIDLMQHIQEARIANLSSLLSLSPFISFLHLFLSPLLEFPLFPNRKPYSPRSGHGPSSYGAP